MVSVSEAQARSRTLPRYPEELFAAFSVQPTRGASRHSRSRS
jgi:hypothetical protein